MLGHILGNFFKKIVYKNLHLSVTQVMNLAKVYDVLHNLSTITAIFRHKINLSN